MRLNHILKEVGSYQNILDAYHKSCKGKRTKRKRAIDKFDSDYYNNIQKVQNDILNNSIKLYYYNKFYVYEPKKRMIFAAQFPDRIIHHALINILEPSFEKYMIDQCCACRKGKGIDYALSYAQKYCRKYDYYIKLDIHKYFDNIDHNILIKFLYKLIKDKDVMKLLIEIIKSYHYENNVNKGVPIGNLTSQYFANLYLTPLDHYIKNELQIKGYVRYMDDFIIFGEKYKLKSALQKIKYFITNILKLELNEPISNNVNNSVPFLGFSVAAHDIRLLKKSKRRFIKHFNKLKEKLFEDKITKSQFIESLTAMIACLRRSSCEGFLIKIFDGKIYL